MTDTFTAGIVVGVQVFLHYVCLIAFLLEERYVSFGPFAMFEDKAHSLVRLQIFIISSEVHFLAKKLQVFHMVVGSLVDSFLFGPVLFDPVVVEVLSNIFVILKSLEPGILEDQILKKVFAINVQCTSLCYFVLEFTVIHGKMVIAFRR